MLKERKNHLRADLWYSSTPIWFPPSWNKRFTFWNIMTVHPRGNISSSMMPASHDACCNVTDLVYQPPVPAVVQASGQAPVLRAHRPRPRSGRRNCAQARSCTCLNRELPSSSNSAAESGGLHLRARWLHNLSVGSRLI